MSTDAHDEQKSRGEERRKEFEEYYASLTPEERRDRIVLAPEFSDLYNEIIQAHRIIQVPHYFWLAWVPRLGPLATTLYITLRQYVFYNPRTGEKRDWCWPKQATLCDQIGIRDRESLRKGLRLLEENGFIRRERTYRKDPHTGLARRSSDKYFIRFEIPLIDSDAVELLIRQTNAEDLSIDAGSSNRAVKPPYRKSPVENTSNRAVKPPYTAGGKTRSLSNTISSTNNVNVVSKTTENSEDHDRAEDLAQQLSEILNDADSLGFYRLIAGKLSQDTLWRALGLTKEAHQLKQIRTTRARYFTDTVKRLAQEQRIDLHLGSANE